MKLLMALVLCLTSALTADLRVGEKPTDFIRIDEDADSARLQTSLTTYVRDGIKVTLIGAIHIADQVYFEQLNEEFKKYDRLLFELIGGEAVAKNLNGQPRPAEEQDGRPAEELRDLYSSLAKTMQLAEQISLIDYTPANFVHADLTKAEYEALIAERGDNLLAFAVESSIRGSELSEKPFGGIDVGIMMRAMLSGDSSSLKMEYMKMMEKGDESAAAITGENVIISERNKKCLQVLAREMAAGHKDLAIFYGAAHFPDLEQRLIAMGFALESHRWVTAWDVKKPAKPKAQQARE